jgi:hypothetical protein
MASQHGDRGAIPAYITWDLWWTNWHRRSFSPNTLISPASSHPTNCPTLINHSIIRRCIVLIERASFNNQLKGKYTENNSTYISLGMYTFSVTRGMMSHQFIRTLPNETAHEQYCDVHAVGQQSQQRKCLFTPVARQRTTAQQWKRPVFSLGFVPVMTSCNSRGIGDGISFVVLSPVI